MGKIRHIDNKKIIISLLTILIVLALLTSFAGCNGLSGEGKEETKKITDCAGRTVEIPKNPDRVACLYAPTAHMMALLDKEDRIVGAPNGVKSDVLIQMKYPGIRDVAVPYQEGSINVEELLRVDADLLLIRKDTLQNEGEMEKLEKLGIPYAVVDYETIPQLYRAVRVAGDIFGEEEKAEAYIEFCKETTDLVSDNLREVTGPKPRIFHSVNEATRTHNRGDICSEILTLGGVDDVISSEEQGGLTAEGSKVYTTLEQIYTWNPDGIIANEQPVTAYILTDPKWAGLDAVKNKQVYTLPVGISRWCHPGSIEPHMGILAVAVRFHPEEMKSVDMKKYTKEYYKKYFGLKLDDETIERILMGEGMRKPGGPVT
ncbi:MAG: ABC transporter substrate-binding protein [Anaerovoracaceae bacterium]